MKEEHWSVYQGTEVVSVGVGVSGSRRIRFVFSNTPLNPNLKKRKEKFVQDNCVNEVYSSLTPLEVELPHSTLSGLVTPSQLVSVPSVEGILGKEKDVG